MQGCGVVRRALRGGTALAAALALVVLGACGGDDGGPPGTPVLPGTPDAGPVDPGTGASWTVLVYMNADNDLEPFAMQDLQEMMQVGSGANFNLVVEVDRHPGYSSVAVGGLGNFTDAKRVKVNAGSLQVLQELGERDLAAPGELSSFIQWGLQQFPADRVAVLFWDHGGGWTGFGVDETTGRGQLLTVPEIVQGLSQGLGGTRAALIGFDACLMANYEVALTLAPYGNYLLASEELEPGHGWDWTAFATAKADPGVSPIALSQSILEKYRAQAQASQSGDSTITLSLVDLTALPAVKAAVKAFTDAVGTDAARIAALAAARTRAQSYQTVGAQPDEALHLFDLKDLTAEAAAGSTALQAAATQVQQALATAVKANVAGRARPGSFGLSVYFPPNGYMDAGYDAITGGAEWRAFVRSTYGVSAPVPQFAVAEPTVSDTTAGLDISASLTSASVQGVATTTMLYGLSDGTNHFLLGEEPAGLSGTTVASTWDKSVLVLEQGATKSYAYGAFEVGNGYIALNVDFAYYTSASATTGRYCVRQLVFTQSSTGWELASDLYYVQNGEAWGELVPDSGGRLTPVVRQLVQTSSGLEINYVEALDLSEAFSAGDFIMPSFETLASGTGVIVALMATNASGQGDLVFRTGGMP